MIISERGPVSTTGTAPGGLPGEVMAHGRGKRMRGLVLACGLLLGLLVGCGSGAAAPAQPPAAPAQPPATTFTAQTLSGDTFDAAAAFAEQPTVLWFWAPWCVICRAEAPEVLAVAAELDGEVAFVGVAGRGEEAAMRDFVADTRTAGLDHVVDQDGSIWSGFGVVSQPAFAFVDADGVVEVFNGSMPPADLRAAARALAKG